jgi:predicted metal-dependent peptidase
MIINSNIEKGICIAPTKRPTENVLLLPDDYSDVHVLEPLYEWLLKSGKVKFVDPFDCHNLESDDPDTWNATVDNAIKSATARGNVSNNIQKLIGELRHTSENYLRVLKKVLAQECGYAVKDKTWTRENRYELEAKGKRKRGQVINAVVDTSGSMWGVLDEAFSVLFRDGYIINLVLSDCEVKDTKRLYSKNDLKKLKASGGGGTAMQPGIDYCQEHWPHIPTIVITDGFCEPSLTFHGTGNVLLLVDTGNPDIIGRARVIRKR